MKEVRVKLRFEHNIVGPQKTFMSMMYSPKDKTNLKLEVESVYNIMQVESTNE